MTQGSHILRADTAEDLVGFSDPALSAAFVKNSTPAALAKFLEWALPDNDLDIDDLTCLEASSIRDELSSHTKITSFAHKDHPLWAPCVKHFCDVAQLCAHVMQAETVQVRLDHLTPTRNVIDFSETDKFHYDSVKVRAVKSLTCKATEYLEDPSYQEYRHKKMQFLEPDQVAPADIRQATTDEVLIMKGRGYRDRPTAPQRQHGALLYHRSPRIEEGEGDRLVMVVTAIKMRSPKP